MKCRALWVGCVWLAVTAGATAEEIGYVEDFALAKDRTEALKQLVPGTEDFYYYNCLYLQNLGQFDRVDQLLQTWIQRYNLTPRAREIQYRQALLTYSQHPKESLEFLQRTLNLQFNHQRQSLDARPDLPTELDPGLLDRQRLLQDALQGFPNLEGFENAALDWLTQTELPADRRRNLLERLERPDHPNLPALVVADLQQPGSGGFGSLPIHRQLLQAQLDECLKLLPDLLNQTEFVKVYLTRLRPSDDIDVAQDLAARQAYLERLWDFVSRLAPAHNSLKLHVLHHRLLLDREQGVYDQPRFLAYLALPRSAAYVNPKYLAPDAQGRFAADVQADFAALTGLPPVGDDEPLVRSFLQHFFLTETSIKPYQEYLEDTYVKRVLAETKLIFGLGDAEQWSALLPPEQYVALKQRVDLDFAATNRRTFAADEPVQLDLWVKNVPTLLVKIYEINTLNYYRQQQREVNTDVNLDGLVANAERTVQYEEPPVRRVARHFEFPELAKPGVYVIDFIGNGKNSRAVIRKGQLRHIVRASTVGHIFTVLDEHQQLARDASIWLADHEYRAGDNGEIVVPYSTQPGRQAIVLTHAGWSSLAWFEHAAENYELTAGLYVDRESLLARKTAQLLVRPALRVNGTPVTLSDLENVRLTLASTDQDGVTTTKEVRDFALAEDRETIYEFQVPPRLSTLQVTLAAQVKSLSLQKKIDLAVSQQFALNGLDQTDEIKDVHLTNFAGQYTLELLGKNGEPRPHQAVHVALKHRDFRRAIETDLQTTDAGQVLLGPLADIDQLVVSGPVKVPRTWPLRTDEHSLPTLLHAQAGATVEIPYMGAATTPQRAELALLELRAGAPAVDRFAALQLSDGLLRIVGLPAGDYDLWLKRAGARIRLRIAAGDVQRETVLGAARQLELRNSQPLQIKSLTLTDTALQIALVNVTPFARVHVLATRYEPAYAVCDYLGRVRDREPESAAVAGSESFYAAGRQLGDEQRYILDRKYAAKFPGNMLERPSLLLNPWALRGTETGQQAAKQGEAFGAQPPATVAAPAAPESAAEKAPPALPPSADLDFLAAGSTVMTNLVPNAQGLLSIDRRQLGSHQRVWVVAIDPQNTACRSLTLPENPRQCVDLRLARGLDPAKHFTQQKQISAVEQGETFRIEDITTARFEVYDSLAKVHALLVTLSKNPTLAEFGFILQWDQLKPEEKREKYSKYACHELNYFLYRKDPAFFEAVVLPYLKNKKDKTFLDDYLVGSEVQRYLEPWQYAQLNMVERILLAQRVAGEQSATSRAIADIYDVAPVDVDRFNFLFHTALQGGALETEPTLGRRMEERVTELAADFSLSEATTGAPSAPMGGMGGMGGGAAGVAHAAATDMPADGRFDEQARAKLSDEVAKAGDSLGLLAGGRRDRGEKADRFFARDRAAGAYAPQLFRQLDQTQEWAENNYYHLPIAQQNGALVPVNAFWRDYAAQDPQRPFRSTHVAEACGNFTEMMFALSVLDLPLHSVEQDATFDGTQMILTAKSPLLAFHEEIRAAAPAPDQPPILVSQNFFRLDDRYRIVNNQQVDKYVTEEFLVETVYGCQIVVTNPTSAPQKLTVLLQVPQGAIPVLNGQYTRGAPVKLDPFATTTLEYFFYFPQPGAFTHYPVHVAQNAELLAAAPAVSLQAVAQLTKIDRTAWPFLSQNGTNEEVLTYLQNENLQRIDLEQIAFRMQDPDFFRAVTKTLAARHIYHPTLWSYAIRHNVPEQIQVFLEHLPEFVAQCGPALQSPLLTIDPVARHSYQHLEYRPLVNARAHRLGARREIVNDRLLQQYRSFLAILSCQRELTDEQLLAVTYYLLLQDRVEEALNCFGRVRPEQLAERLQYDYFTAYLDFFTADPQQAGAIVARYAEYPVDRWRQAFAAIGQQLAEIHGQATAVVNPEDQQQAQTGLAATEPNFEFQVEARKIALHYQHVTAVRVNYYVMDIELLFSGNPFVQQYTGQFSTIKPNFTAAVDLPADAKSTDIELPAQLLNSNVLVEITGGGVTRSQVYYANSLDVQLSENYGQVQVRHQTTKQPLGQVYVKVYARLKDGQVVFYKDGYTDLRGRFDYASLSTNQLDTVDRFALLILSETNGAVIREAAPPKR